MIVVLASNTNYEYDLQITSIKYITERTPNPNWKIDNHTNVEAYVFAYAIDGKATYLFNDTQKQIQKGDMLFFPKGFSRSAYSDSQNPWSFFSIAFDVEFLNTNTLEMFNEIPNVLRIPNMYKLPSLFADISHIWHGRRPGYLVKCKSILLEIIYLIINEITIANINTRHYAAIEKVINMLHSNYKNRYSIADLSSLTGLSSSHFRLLFKDITGYSISQYQNNIKINKAKDLLLSGDCNVGEAAISVGFDDIFYFSRLFKKLTGINPSDFSKFYI